MPRSAGVKLEKVGLGVQRSIDRIGAGPDVQIHFPALRQIELWQFLDYVTPYTLLKAIQAPSLCYLWISHGGQLVNHRTSVIPDENTVQPRGLESERCAHIRRQGRFVNLLIVAYVWGLG